MIAGLYSKADPETAAKSDEVFVPLPVSINASVMVEIKLRGSEAGWRIWRREA